MSNNKEQSSNDTGSMRNRMRCSRCKSPCRPTLEPRGPILDIPFWKCPTCGSVTNSHDAYDVYMITSRVDPIPYEEACNKGLREDTIVDW